MKIKIIIIKYKRRNRRIREITNLENNINKKIPISRMIIINKKIFSHKKTIFLLEIEIENLKNKKNTINKKNISLLLNTNLH